MQGGCDAKASGVIFPQRREIKMNRLQELANAATQVVPSLAMAYIAREQEWIPMHAAVLVLGAWVHLPFSFHYHLRCALRHDDISFDSLGCWSRRLDHTFIHVAASCFTYGTSHGSVAYTGVATLFNATAAALHWHSRVDMRRNQILAIGAFAIYMLPVVARGDYWNSMCTLLAFIPAGLIFMSYVFGGYSHSIFHLGMTGVVYFILQAALASH